MDSTPDSRRQGRAARPPRYQHRAMSDAHAHSDSSDIVPTRHTQHPLASPDRPELITRPDELANLLDSLRKAGSFAYDSEFIGELTYLPNLCLVQAASTTRIALIDPLADLDIRPFWELVADPSVEKIVHAGQQDVEPVFRALGRGPANLFDTQIAAGFVGIGYPLSLTRLVQAIIGAKLGKGLTFSHWDRRPLSDHQLRYAADDVRYLPAVRHEIGKRLSGPNHAKWAMEESASLADQTLYVFDPETQWMKIRGSGTLSPRNQALLKELTIWRDNAAKTEDIPPRSLLKDEILLDLARSPVDAIADLARVKGLPRNVESKYGAGIVEATERVRNFPEDQLPVIKGYEASPSEKFAGDAIYYAIQCLSAAQGIDPSLVASRQEVGELYRLLSTKQDAGQLRILRGWRREAVGDRMLELLKGHGELSFGWSDGIFRIPRHHSGK